VLQLRGSGGGAWPCRFPPAWRTDADRSNAPAPGRCPSTNAAAAASASSSMAAALAEPLAPALLAPPREEVEDRRFAGGGPDGDAEGQGSEMQESSEPIGPGWADWERTKKRKKILASAAAVQESGFGCGEEEKGKEEEEEAGAIAGCACSAEMAAKAYENLYFFQYRRFGS
jgi:hypothetical protein